MTNIADRALERGLRVSAWALYSLIVFEILFMISPFAFYYYSVYSRPLNWLQQSALTSWLTLHILPHFTYTESWLSNALILISWPLILSGMLLFLVGFVQIYWAKFTRRGQVAGGLYRYGRRCRRAA